jgi:hypothetical protein
LRGKRESERRHGCVLSFCERHIHPLSAEKKIKTFAGMTPVVMIELQNHLLLDKGDNPVGVMFYHFLMKGYIAENFFDKVKTLMKTGNAARGCHEIGAVRGAVIHGEKAYNKKLARRQVAIEHINTKIKTFKSMAHPYRGHCRNRHALRMTLICGIIN